MRFNPLNSLRSLDLTGKVALVTGGSRGLGLALTRELLLQGCRVAICARVAHELESARLRLVDAGPITTYRCDLADEDAAEQMVKDIQLQLGPIDLLFNNAGAIQVGPLENLSTLDFEEAMDNNFWGAVYLTLAVLPEMRRRRQGNIVNITSIGGKVAVPHLLPYDCAKFALLGFSQGLHAELVRDGIRVTTVIPGLMRTGSPWNAQFKGSDRELTWFAVTDLVPLLSMSAERAARRIVAAARRGQAEVTLSLSARLLSLVHDLFPSLTTELLGLLNGVMPAPTVEQPDARSGSDLARRIPPVLYQPLLRLARRYNQVVDLKAS